MRHRREYPREIRTVEHLWIPMSDGTRLGARIWVPVDAAERPVPAILEYIPYRKNDRTAVKDSDKHPYFAGHGYAALRVDMRGGGDSEGYLEDEYLPQEQLDALEVIEWIAAQPWCTGRVGMMGISWGGFNSLQVAALRPPALKAVITACSTDDRYACDVHYSGGCILGTEMLSWASHMLLLNALPPDPHSVGEAWRKIWFERMEKSPPFIAQWMAHQRRDAYWKKGSVCEDYSAITSPVFAVGGWADGYSNTVMNLLAGLSCPRKGLVGPWGHPWPHQGLPPGPHIGFLQEALRWWDYWLKGRKNGIMDEPFFRVWMQESVAPARDFPDRPGRWVAESSWPSPRIEAEERSLGESGTLDRSAGPERTIEYLGSQYTGRESGLWLAAARLSDLPGDQRSDDGLSLCFDSEPLEAAVEILGFPEIRLRVSFDRPRAILAARLCDVAPNGMSTLITRGYLNLTHRQSHEHPADLEPGREYDITVRLDAVAHAMPRGHRWRLGLSTAYWPMLWPAPDTVTMSLITGAPSRLILPVRPPRGEDSELREFDPPEGARPLERVSLPGAPPEMSRTEDVISRTVEVRQCGDDGFHLPSNGIELCRAEAHTYRIADENPLTASVCSECNTRIGRGDWQVRIHGVSEMSADRHHFHVNCRLQAFENDAGVFARTWSFSIPRDHV